MSDACTIILPTKDFLSVLTILKQFLDPVLIVGSETHWERLETKSSENSLVFRSLVRVAPGDQFSKLILGLHQFARNLRGINPTRFTELLREIENAEMLIGVVATPDFSANALYEEAVFAVAESLHGIVFTGSSFVSGSGDVFE